MTLPSPGSCLITSLAFQRFVGEFSGATVDQDPNKLSSSFPSFIVDDNVDLGFLAFGGIMFGDTHKKIGR